MNNKLFTFAAAAVTLLTFAACNKDDQKIDVVTPEMANAYAKVSIAMPSVTGTRAATSETGSNSDNPSFDAGSTEEQSISKIFLALYDDFNNYVGIGRPYSDIKVDGEKGTNWKEGTGSGDVSNTITHVFKLELIGDNVPTQVVAFVNFDEGAIDKSNLAALTSGKAFDGELYDTANGKDFLMTNAGYYNANDGTGEYLVAAKLGKIFHTEAEAQEALETNKATIYVERLAAKVTIKNALTSQSQNDLNFIVEDVLGKEVKLEFVPSYWGATGTATSEYYVKTPFENNKTWNLAANHRSFWAEGVNYNKDFASYYADKKTTGLLDYIQYIYENGGLNVSKMGMTDITTTGTSQYVREHTSNLQDIQGQDIIANTYALVIGNYKLSEGTDVTWFKRPAGDGSADPVYDFYLLLKEESNGKNVFTIYNKSQLIGYLLHWNGAATVKVSGSDVEYTTLPTDNTFFGEDGKTENLNFAEYLDLKYVDGKYQLTALTGAEKTLTYVKGEESVTIEGETLDGMNKSTFARNYHYDAGSAYFNVPIAHDKSGAVTTYGVVRNHTYVLSINKIENLGAPLNGDIFGTDDPDDPKPIIPDPDDFKDNFINAEINVLSWHLIENGVTL